MLVLYWRARGPEDLEPMDNESPVLTVLIPLPLTYNPDRKGNRRRIEESKFQDTMTEIANQLGGGILWRFENDAPSGNWWNEGHVSQDILAMLEVDVPNT